MINIYIYIYIYIYVCVYYRQLCILFHSESLNIYHISGRGIYCWINLFLSCAISILIVIVIALITDWSFSASGKRKLRRVMMTFSGMGPPLFSFVVFEPKMDEAFEETRDGYTFGFVRAPSADSYSGLSVTQNQIRFKSPMQINPTQSWIKRWYNI